MRVSLAPILIAEGARQTRRWSFTAVRLGWAGVLAAVVVAMWIIAIATGHEAPAVLGRHLFMQERDLQVVLAALVGPMLVALGCVEERESGGLELLGLTRLSARQILWGKVATRLMALLAVDLAAVPLIVALRELGGVSDLELVLSFANGIAMMVAMAGIAGLIALSTGRAIGALLVAMTWGGIAFLVAPEHLAAPPWQISPVHGMVGFTTDALLPIAALIPVIGMIDLWGTALVGGRRTRGWWLAALVCGALGIGLSAVGFAWPGAVLGLVAWTGTCLEGGLWLLGGSTRRRIGPALWWLTGLWSWAVFQIWWSTPGNTIRIDEIEPSLSLLIIGVVAAVAAGQEAFGAEREAGTLDLLLATPLSGPRMVWRKLLTVAARSLPLLLLGAAARGPQFLPWIVPFWAVVALGTMTIGLLAPPRIAWGASMLLVFVWFIGVAQLELVPDGDLVRALIAAPVVTERVVSIGEIAVSTAGHAVLAAFLYVGLAWIVRR